jgi:hypothetical protein
MKLTQKQLRSLVEASQAENMTMDVSGDISTMSSALVTTIIDELVSSPVAANAATMVESADPDFFAPARYEDVDHFATLMVNEMMKSPDLKDILHTLSERVLRELMRPGDM